LWKKLLQIFRISSRIIIGFQLRSYA